MEVIDMTALLDLRAYIHAHTEHSYGIEGLDELMSPSELMRLVDAMAEEMERNAKKLAGVCIRVAYANVIAHRDMTEPDIEMLRENLSDAERDILELLVAVMEEAK